MWNKRPFTNRQPFMHHTHQPTSLSIPLLRVAAAAVLFTFSARSFRAFFRKNLQRPTERLKKKSIPNFYWPLFTYSKINFFWLGGRAAGIFMLTDFAWEGKTKKKKKTTFERQKFRFLHVYYSLVYIWYASIDRWLGKPSPAGLRFVWFFSGWVFVCRSSVGHRMKEKREWIVCEIRTGWKNLS